MTPLDSRIERFISNHNTLTLATAVEDQPYCCSLLYAFEPDKCLLHFMSSNDTRHIKDVLKNPKVAGTITNETKIISNIQGIQFTGCIRSGETENADNSKSIYLARYPIAKIFNASLWTIEIDFIKYVNNTLGFKKKIKWQRYLTDAII